MLMTVFLIFGSKAQSDVFFQFLNNQFTKDDELDNSLPFLDIYIYNIIIMMMGHSLPQYTGNLVFQAFILNGTVMYQNNLKQDW